MAKKRHRWLLAEQLMHVGKISMVGETLERFVGRMVREYPWPAGLRHDLAIWDGPAIVAVVRWRDGRADVVFMDEPIGVRIDRQPPSAT